MAKEFNESSFDQDVVKSDKASVVDFYTTTCGPCRRLAPVVDKLAAEYDGVVQVGKCNVMDNLNLAAEYNVNAVPTIIVFKGGKEVERHLGVLSEDALRGLVEKHK